MIRVSHMVIEKRGPKWQTVLGHSLLLASYMVFIFYISSQSFGELQLPEIWGIDKLIHIVEYGILGILWFRTIGAITGNLQIAAAIAFVITFIYGISDEVHQYFVPNRNSSIYDAIVDGLGALLGIWLYRRRL